MCVCVCTMSCLGIRLIAPWRRSKALKRRMDARSPVPDIIAPRHVLSVEIQESSVDPSAKRIAECITVVVV